jgi:hypothetical protein
MRQSIEGIFDHDSHDVRRALMSAVGASRGLWEWKVKPRKATRSLRQNAWYWSCLITPLFQHLRDQDWDINSPVDVHEMVALKFLPRVIANRRTGEIMRTKLRRSTRELNTEEFSDYCERLREWMAATFDIIVPDPEPEPERRAKPVTVRVLERKALPDQTEGVLA